MGGPGRYRAAGAAEWHEACMWRMRGSSRRPTCGYATLQLGVG